MVPVTCRTEYLTGRGIADARAVGELDVSDFLVALQKAAVFGALGTWMGIAVDAGSTATVLKLCVL